MGNLCTVPDNQDPHARADVKNQNVRRKPQSYGENQLTNNDAEYSVIMSNKDEQHSDVDLNELMANVNGNKSPTKDKPAIQKLDKPFNGFLNLRIQEALLVKAKLLPTMRQNFEKGSQGEFEDQYELKCNIKYAKQTFKGLSKGFLVSDKADSASTTGGNFHSFNIAFKDEVAHNLNKFGTNPGEKEAPVAQDDLEQFDIQVKNGKDKDTFDIELTLRENYQNTKGLKIVGVAKVSITELLLQKQKEGDKDDQGWKESWHSIMPPPTLPGQISAPNRQAAGRVVPGKNLAQKKEPIGQINIQTRFEDKEKKNAEIAEMSPITLPISPELDFQFTENPEGHDDKDKFNKIGVIGKSGNFEEVQHSKNYEALTDEELDQQILMALDKQKLQEKEHIYEHENAINEESQSNYTSEANVSEGTKQMSEADFDRDFAQSEKPSFRESERAEEEAKPPSPPSQAVASSDVTGAPVAPIEINSITILKNVSKLKARRVNQRSKQKNINEMMQMSSGSIHDLRSSQPQPTVLGSGRMATTTLVGAGDALSARAQQQVSASMVEGDAASPFKKAAEVQQDNENAEIDEGISNNNKSQLNDAHAATDINTRRQSHNIAMRSHAAQALGAGNEEDVFDESNHRMLLKTKPSGPIVAEHQKEEIFCHVCSDAIDVVLGWYNCPKCKFDYCRECALDRHRLEDEMAENPIFIPTPMADIQRESNKNATKQFNFSIIQNEVQRGTSFAAKKELQSTAGQFLTGDLKFEFELQELGLTKQEFDETKTKMFEENADKFKFKPRPGNSLDKKLNVICKLLKIKTIPIIHLKESLFFVGIYKVIIEMKGDFLMVKVGSKQFERFADYLKQNKVKFEQQLILLSLKNDNIDMVDVVNNLVMRNYMNGLQNSFMTNMSFSRASNASGMQGLGALSARNSVGAQSAAGKGVLFSSGGMGSTNAIQVSSSFANRMADGGISDRGGGRRGTSLFMKSPERRMTEKKSGGTTVTSPSGKASDFHADIKELMKAKSTPQQISAQPASADAPVVSPKDDDIDDDDKDKKPAEIIDDKNKSQATISNYDKEKERIRMKGRERRANNKIKSAVQS